jgi:hypothetical protein
MEFVQVQKSIIYHHKGTNNSEYKLSDSFYGQGYTLLSKKPIGKSRSWRGVVHTTLCDKVLQ